MSDPKVYRSTFTAAEIEKILKSVGLKINADSIVTDIDTGGAANVISAETLKTTINKIINETTGDGLKTAINAATDSNVFTDTHKTSLENMSLRFIGTKANITERNNVATTSFIGGEVILLLKNESEQAVFQYWDNAATAWKDVYRAENREITVANAGDSVLKQFPKTKFKGIEASIIAKGPGSDSDFHMTTVRCAWKGADIYLTSYGDLFNAELFSIEADVATGDAIALKATTLSDNISIRVEITNAF